jgi:hypothetical protein
MTRIKSTSAMHISSQGKTIGRRTMKLSGNIALEEELLEDGEGVDEAPSVTRVGHQV